VTPRVVETALGHAVGAAQRLMADGAGAAGSEPTDEQVLQRYVVEHRGRPEALVQFAAEHAQGEDPRAAAAEYEREMERQLAEWGGEAWRR
jgi:hypothetical protein